MYATWQAKLSGLLGAQHESITPASVDACALASALNHLSIAVVALEVQFPCKQGQSPEGELDRKLAYLGLSA